MSAQHKSVRLLRAMVILVVLAMCLALIAAPTSSVAPVRGESTTGKISNDVLQATANGQSTSFIVFLQDQADVSAAYNMTDQDARGWYVYNTLKEHAARTQAPIINQLEAAGAPHSSFWAANMIVVDGDRSLVEAMAARPDVKVIETNAVSDGINGEDGPETTDEGNAVEAIETGLNNVQAPSLWNLGYKGQGIVVANQDTGMRWTHNALRTHYRGWISGTSANNNYNWWDAIHVQIGGDGGTGSPATNPCGRNITAPCDDQGHGTHTTGTIVGYDGGTNQIGVAPEAKWIGCRNMDSGNGRAATYSECFQFFIAPTDLNGQNPDPTKRPHVMNNSWTCPLAGELCARNALLTIVQNTEAAGIFVEGSAGNDGPNCSTVQDPPAIYSSAFSTGAISGSSNALQSFSSRGPVTSDGSGRMKPDLVAPGASVRSSLRTSDTSYGTMSGTSMAGPHVVGVVALLWSARPNLARDVPRTEYLLTRSANRNGITVANNSTGCGGIASTPNNHFGWGRVDALAAYNLEPSLNQTITFDALPNKTFGDADFGVSATASSGLAVSFSASGTCTISGNTVHITGAGSCTVTASQAGLDVYGIATTAPKPWYPAPNVSRTFSIARANATINVTPYSVTYDGAAHTATGTATGVLNESLSGLDLGSTTHTNAGSYTDNWTFTDVTGNYNNASGTVADKIAKAILTVTADNQKKIFNAPNPAFTFQVTGFKNGETATVLTTQPACTSAATQTSPVGTYAITCSGGAAGNYDFAYFNGLLNILYNFTGFSQPVDNPLTLNTANSGQAIPLKWRITDVNGNPVTDLASVKVTALDLACSLGTTPDQLEEYAPGASGLLNQGNGNYQFNWKTPTTYAKSCKTMKLDLGEGPGYEHTALFQFPK